MHSLKKTFTFLFLLAVSQGFSSPTYASGFSYSSSVRAKIIDDFKGNQFDNIYNSNVLLSEDTNFFDTQNKIMMFETIAENNTAQKDALTIKEQVLGDRVQNISDALELLDEDIQNTQDEIMNLWKNIVLLKYEIDDTQDQITQKISEINETKKVLLDYIAHLYKKQNTLYNTDQKEIDSLKTILLSDGTLGDILSQLHFTSVLELTGQSLVEQYRKLMVELFVKKSDLEKKKRDLKDSQQQEMSKKRSLVEKKEFRTKILEYTKWQQDLYQQFIADKMQVERNLKAKIIQNKIKLTTQKKELLEKYNCNYINDALLTSDEIYLMDENTGDKTCDELNTILSLESQLKPFSSEKQNVFSWPVDPVNGLSAYYKDPEYTDVVGSTHDAIDIPTPQGTDIKAPADGYVTYLRAPNDEGYAYIALKHASGFVTVYGHINEVLVGKYDFVKKWEVFARSGGEIGTYGAGPMTTGAHLHFEVFKDREYVDPLNYLNIAQMPEAKVPQVQKYAYKYKDDYKELTGEDYSGTLLESLMVFKLKWDTEVERQKYLLANYATPDFNNWSMWIEEAVDESIDPSFLMCIWLAESGLGRNLKTTYNVGNVGNTDSGGTWDFDTPRSGVYWIAKTLNNQFLGQYQTMDKLSRYGNKTWAIYASSDSNWQNNIVRCLSALKWEHIPDNFRFRMK